MKTGITLWTMIAALAGGAALWAAESPPSAMGRMVVFVSPYCDTCRKFEAEVADRYSKTDIGQRLPMVLVDTFDPPADFAERARYVAFTPCMVVENPDGKEVARIRGYRGDEFFWGELDSIVRKLDASATLSRQH